MAKPRCLRLVRGRHLPLALTPILGSRAADGGTPRYVPDHQLLEELIGIPVGEGRASEPGRLAKAIDAWVAHELRRCGFPPDEVWPRLQRPRVLPREVGLFLDGLPQRLQAAGA